MLWKPDSAKPILYFLKINYLYSLIVLSNELKVGLVSLITSHIKNTIKFWEKGEYAAKAAKLILGKKFDKMTMKAMMMI